MFEQTKHFSPQTAKTAINTLSGYQDYWILTGY